MANNWMTEEISFKRYEVAGAGVALMVLGLLMMRQRQAQQQFAFGAGCAYGYGAGVRHGAQVAAQGLPAQSTRAVMAQPPAQTQSGEGSQLAPYGWGYPEGGGMGALVSYDPNAAPWFRQML